MFGCPGRETCIQAWAYRVEFQGGKHRAAPAPGFAHRVYLGTGVPHRHIAFWASDKLTTGDLLRWMRADLPADFPSLASAVLKIQAPNPGQTPQLPIGTVSSWMDDETHLKHCEADEQAGVHPHLAPLCLSHVFHTNVSQVRKPSHVAGYMTKCGLHQQTNQHLGSNWLTEARSSFSPALMYLIGIRSSSAEMLNPLSTGSTFQLSCYRKDVSICAADDRASPAYALFELFLQGERDDSYVEWHRRRFRTQDFGVGGLHWHWRRQAHG